MFSFLHSLMEPKSNAPEVAGLLVNILNAKITATTLSEEIRAHPDYPSLLSISDVLNNHGIDNVSMSLPPIKLKAVPVPFLVPIKGEKNTIPFFSVVRKIEGDTFFFYDTEKHKWTSLLYEDFIKRYAGKLLIVDTENTNLKGEKDYDKKLKDEKRKQFFRQLAIFAMPIILITASITAFLQQGIDALLSVIFSLITLTGAIVGTLLVWYEIDRYNPVLQQICSGGKKINCNAILQSDASKIFGISWSSIGFTYFIGQLILLIVLGITNPQILFIISWINVLALPYIFFSIYYQWRIAKQWCVLCLWVQSLLALQFIIALLGGWHNLFSITTLNAQWILSIIMVFAITLITVNMVTAALEKAKDGERNKRELQRLKFNSKMFAALLEKQKLLEESPEGLGITLGKPDAQFRIIKVCNPYCGPCAAAHPVLETLLEQDNIQLQIIFTATNSDGDFRAPPAKHLLAISQKNNKELTKKALDDWYMPDKKDYNVFAAKYPMNGELEQQAEKLNAMSDWCKETDIRFTPTFFISLPVPENEKHKEAKFYKLPALYSVDDLKILLTELNNEYDDNIETYQTAEIH